MQTVTVQIENRADRRAPLQIEAEVVGQRIIVPVLAKAPTGTKTYAATVWMGNIDTFDPEKIHRAPRTATVRNRNWSVVAIGREAAESYTNRY